VGTTAGTLAAADTVTPAAADVVTAATGSVSLSIRTGDAVGAAGAGELAAIAAAAIASGAEALPDAGVAGATSVETMVTAIATATGFGVVTSVASCWAEAPRAEESSAGERPGAEAVSEIACGSVDFFSIGFSVPAFKMFGLAPDGWTASVLALLSASGSELCLAVALRSSALLPTAWSAGPALRDRLLSAAAGISSARRGEAGCCCAVALARSWAVSEGALLSIRAWKPSFPCDGSGLADLDGGARKDRLAAASGVTLNTGGLSE
jgi:hypothetical protein